MTPFGYRVLGFGSGGSSPEYNIDYQLVAGGGGGGQGGGGGGGYIHATSATISGTCVVTVGAGGAKLGTDGDTQGDPGDDSVFSTFTAAVGGGGGAAVQYPGSDADGGSGGGSKRDGGSPGDPVAGQGYIGGETPYGSPWWRGAGGGGGAGGAGQPGGSVAGGSAGTETGGDGGIGKQYTIGVSASDYHSSGGGGGCQGSGGRGDASDGGGGYGAISGIAAQDGTANTGGGGGGGYPSGASGENAAGGSGRVILKIADADYSGTTTGSPTVDTSTDASYTFLIYTGSGSYST